MPPDTTVANLPLSHFCVEATALCRLVRDRFLEDRCVPGVVICEAGEVRCALSRARFLERLSRPYALDVFLNRPLRDLPESVRLPTRVLSGDTSISEAVSYALSRGDELTYEPLVVQTEQGFGLLDVRLLLLRHARIFEVMSGRLDTQARALSQANHQLQQQIAERLRYEEKLREAQLAAERATHIKSQFLANMSHEIRTPLYGILGTSELLIESENLLQARDHATTIHTSARSLLAILNDILDFSKLEAGKFTLQSEDFKVRPLVESLLALNTPLSQHKYLRVDASFDAALPEAACGDVTRLRQILGNLINNAIKFTERGGIRVEVRLVSRSATILNVRFAVHDTGIGVPLDRQTALFEPFNQVDQSSTRPYGGTGLGLAICRQFVELMGGEIGVESTPGRGSTFWFHVPLAAAASSPPLPKEPGWKFLPARVLVAEDNPVNQRLLVWHLEKLGLASAVVTTGCEALQALEAPGWDLVLMDCQMPVMDGYQAARVLRERGVRLPIVALTANVQAGERERCLAAGMSDYLSKPCTRSELAAVLARWLPQVTLSAEQRGR